MARRSRGGRRKRSVAGLGTLALLTTVAGVGVDIGPAEAAFPGRNGRILCNRSVPIPNAPPPPAPQTQTEIFAFNPDGSDPRQLTFDPAGDIEPTMSPDGTRIAWTSTRAGGDQEIWIMYQDGSGARRLTFTPGEDRPGTFSPDGTQLAFQSARFPAPSGPGHSSLEILRMQIDGSSPIRLTNNNFQDSFAHWSPLGDRIAFTTNRGTPPETPQTLLSNFFEVYTMDASNGANPVNVTNSLGEDSHAHWSPDAGQLTYHSRRDHLPPVATGVEIYKSNADGSNPVRLTGPDSLFDIFPTWSPDGTKIAWPHDFPSDIWVMNASDGSGKVNITNTPGIDESRCDWSRLLPCTITGSGDISGTTGDDVICGSPGRDRIQAFGGNDVIYPGAGNDDVNAGDGNDIVFGDHGNDRISGGNGRDTLFGDQENDQLLGGPGNDIVSGSEGDDQVNGSDGSDECYGEAILFCELPAPIP